MYTFNICSKGGTCGYFIGIYTSKLGLGGDAGVLGLSTRRDPFTWGPCASRMAPA
jgi:hypothetical protein